MTLEREQCVYTSFQIVWCVPLWHHLGRVVIGYICPREPITVQLPEVSHSRENLKSQNNEPSADLHYFCGTDTLIQRNNTGFCEF